MESRRKGSREMADRWTCAEMVENREETGKRNGNRWMGIFR